MSSILFGCIYLWLDILDKVVVKSDKHVQLYREPKSLK